MGPFARLCFCASAQSCMCRRGLPSVSAFDLLLGPSAFVRHRLLHAVVLVPRPTCNVAMSAWLCFVSAFLVISRQRSHREVFSHAGCSVCGPIPEVTEMLGTGWIPMIPSGSELLRCASYQEVLLAQSSLIVKYDSQYLGDFPRAFSCILLLAL